MLSVSVRILLTCGCFVAPACVILMPSLLSSLSLGSVLYQRGVYHPDTFAREAKYGITTLVTTDEGLKKYLENVIQQLRGEKDSAR